MMQASDHPGRFCLGSSKRRTTGARVEFRDERLHDHGDPFDHYEHHHHGHDPSRGETRQRRMDPGNIHASQDGLSQLHANA